MLVLMLDQKHILYFYISLWRHTLLEPTCHYIKKKKKKKAREQFLLWLSGLQTW